MEPDFGLGCRNGRQNLELKESQAAGSSGGSIGKMLLKPKSQGLGRSGRRA